jgi:hypothetical protein
MKIDWYKERLEIYWYIVNEIYTIKFWI